MYLPLLYGYIFVLNWLNLEFFLMHIFKRIFKPYSKLRQSNPFWSTNRLMSWSYGLLIYFYDTNLMPDFNPSQQNRLNRLRNASKFLISIESDQFDIKIVWNRSKKSKYINFLIYFDIFDLLIDNFDLLIDH